jgi:putative FmdB family regulatory protein
MPLYEYRCDACGHQFERIQRFSDDLVSVCPSCEGGPVVKLLSSPAIQFKGSGWYITDYARKNQGGAAAGKGEGSTGEKSEKSEQSDKDKSEKGDKDKSEKGDKKTADATSSSTAASGSPTPSTTKND